MKHEPPYTLDEEEAEFSFAQALASVNLETADWNPDQPRAPAGSPDGGQWTSGGAGGEGGGSEGIATTPPSASYRRGDHVQITSGPHKGARGVVGNVLYRENGPTTHFVKFHEPSGGKIGAGFTGTQMRTVKEGPPPAPFDLVRRTIATAKEQAEFPPPERGVRAAWKKDPIQPAAGPSLLSNEELQHQSRLLGKAYDKYRSWAREHSRNEEYEGMPSDDYANAVGLLRAIVRDDMEYHRTSERNPSARTGQFFDYAYDKSGGVAGAIEYSIDQFGHCYVSYLGSLQKGGGTKLLATAIQHMIDVGAKEVALSPLSNAIPFYESFGFRYDSGHMTKDLRVPVDLTAPPQIAGALTAPPIPPPVPPAPPAPAEPAAVVRRPGPYAGMYATGGTDAENHARTVDRVLSSGQVMRGIHYRRMLARLLRDSNRFGTPEAQQRNLRDRFSAALTNEYRSFARRGRERDANAIRAKMSRLGFATDRLPPITPPQPPQAPQRQPEGRAPAPRAPARREEIWRRPAVDPTGMDAKQIATAMTAAGGHGTEADVAVVVGSLSAKLPKQILARMARNNVHIVACRDSITDYRQDLTGMHPLGWPPWATFANVTGIYNPLRHEVVVATRGQTERVLPPESPVVALHEALHGYDEFVADKGVFSGRDDFRAAYRADVKNLNSDYYRLPNGRGESETFAEMGAHFFNGDIDRYNVPHIKEWFTQHVRELEGAQA
jgi:hypothetical protein